MKRFVFWATVGIFLFLFFYGSRFMYFHQDDLWYMIFSARGLRYFLSLPYNEHLNYFFRTFFWAEYSLFHLNYSLYFLVSLFAHALNIWLLYKIIYRNTKQQILASSAALVFAINTNWNEILLWNSGQTFTLNFVFALAAIYQVMRMRKGNTSLREQVVLFIFLTLSNLVSSVSAWLPVSLLLVFGFKKRKLTAIGQVSIIFLFALFLGYHFQVESSLYKTYFRQLSVSNLLTLAIFPFAAFANAVVGRLFIPLDSLRVLRIPIVITLALLLYEALRQAKVKLVDLYHNKNFLFSIVSLAIYYCLITFGRAMYGLGASRSERYVYIALALGLIAVAELLKGLKLKKSFLVATCLVVSIQIVGFIDRSNQYVVRPQQVHAMFTHLQDLDRNQCYLDKDLPTYVNEIPAFRYSDLNVLLDKPITYGNLPSCQPI